MKSRWIDESMLNITGDKATVRREGHANQVLQPERPSSKGLDASRHKMNKLESRYAQYLDALKFAGDIQAWKFESVKLRLANACTYTADFLVITQAGATEYHETKGPFMREDSWIKLKVAAEEYPWWTFRIVRYVKGQWDVRIV